MITPPSAKGVWLAAVTDMRKGFDGLAALVQEKLQRDPFGGQIFVFRGGRGDLVKVLWWDVQGLCLFAKRLQKGRFVWLSPADGMARLTPAQLGIAARRYRLADADPDMAGNMFDISQHGFDMVETAAARDKQKDSAE